MSNILGQETRNRTGRKYIMDEAYFARIDAIQFTIAHDDGMNWENWEEADIVLAGVSRASKTHTSIYLANRGYKTANIPIVLESPPPSRSEEHTSELQSLMLISYALFCLQITNKHSDKTNNSVYT